MNTYGLTPAFVIDEEAFERAIREVYDDEVFVQAVREVYANMPDEDIHETATQKQMLAIAEAYARRLREKVAS